MSDQGKNVSRKSRGRPATGKGHTIGVRLQPDLLAKIDALRLKETPAPSRPEAIRQIIEATFQMMGDVSVDSTSDE